MKVAHLILVHNNPLQVEILVNRLQHVNAHIYIHVDKKADENDFAFLAAKEQVFFIQNRVDVQWGLYSCVECTLNGIREIRASKIRYDYINLISGSCLPVKPIAEFHDFLTANNGKAYLHSLNVENDWQEALIRLKYYEIGFLYNKKGRHAVNRWLGQFFLRKRPSGIQFYGRSQWFTIPLLHAEFVVDYLHANKRLRRFFKLTWGADELVFQTILENSSYKNTIVNDNLRYIDWSEKKPSPKNLTMADREAIIKSGAFFARKFDYKLDADIINDLDPLNRLSKNKTI